MPGASGSPARGSHGALDGEPPEAPVVASGVPDPGIRWGWSCRHVAERNRTRDPGADPNQVPHTCVHDLRRSRGQGPAPKVTWPEPFAARQIRDAAGNLEVIIRVAETDVNAHPSICCRPPIDRVNRRDSGLGCVLRNALREEGPWRIDCSRLSAYRSPSRSFRVWTWRSSVPDRPHRQRGSSRRPRADDPSGWEDRGVANGLSCPDWMS